MGFNAYPGSKTWTQKAFLERDSNSASSSIEPISRELSYTTVTILLKLSRTELLATLSDCNHKYNEGISIEHCFSRNTVKGYKRTHSEPIACRHSIAFIVPHERFHSCNLIGGAAIEGPMKRDATRGLCRCRCR